MSLYYSGDGITLYHGDCLTEHREWLEADVLVTDPPYGIGWTRNGISRTSCADRARGDYNGNQRPEHKGIKNDDSVDARESALKLWQDKPAIVFGSLLVAPPPGTKQVAVYVKPADSGVISSYAGVRRDIEALYILGEHADWRWGGARPRSAVFKTGARVAGAVGGLVQRYGGHPHAKPIDVLEGLLLHVAPPGTIADPFAGSGSTLVAARNLGRKAIGVELEERYCEIVAKRLAQGALDFGDAS